jgi:sugar transferase EpsL
MLKRGFDFCVAFTVLVMAIPVMALIAILLAASIGRPVLFRQQRPGLRAQPFMLYKFRTMSERRDAQGELLGDELRQWAASCAVSASTNCRSCSMF